MSYKISVNESAEVTIDDLIAEADAMWRVVKAANLDIMNTIACDAMYDRMHATHRELCTSYPIVVRYMCQMGEYSPIAFRKYINRIRTKTCPSEEEYFSLQADYVVALYKCRHPRWDRAAVLRLHRNIYTILSTERKEFKDKFSAISSAVDEFVAGLQVTSRTELTESCRAIAAAGTGHAAGTIRVVVDDDLAAYSPVDFSAHDDDARDISAADSLLL